MRIRNLTSVKDLLYVGRAAITLVIADAVIRVLPFAAVARRIRREISWLAPPGESAAAVKRVRWAISAAGRRLPWTIRCLAEAVAANRLLASHGVPSELWLGVQPKAAGTDAHAWLVADGCTVTGRGARDRYHPLTSLRTPPPRIR
jgi:hypothetical protein